MTISGVSGRTSYIGSGIMDLRNQLDTLTQQLSSGKISNTYAGDGTGRGLAIGLRAQITSYASYSDTATNLNTRIGVANLSLQRLVAIGSEVKGAAVSAGSTLDNTGQTAGQKTASLDFYDSVDMLNAQSGDRYLFSGRMTDTPPVAPADQIMNGNGAAIAGLKQVIAERGQADLGAAGNGHILLSQPTPTSIQIGEDFAADPTATPPVAATPFGIKLSAISTTSTTATVTQPTETPPPPAVPTVPPTPPSPLAMTVDLGATNAKEGDQFKFTFTMPDGTSEDIVLTASSTIPTPTGSFPIDLGQPNATPPVAPSSAVTAANLNAALTSAVKDLANGPMLAASAVQAGNDFFGSPPMRVAGSPASSATSLVAGTAADTVIWYQGEANTAANGSARGSSVSQIDSSITVQYGARADEQALRTQLQNVAVFAAVTTSVTDTNASGKIAALNTRIAANLAIIPGTQTIQDIQADFAGAQASIKSTTDRQVQSKAMAQTMLDSIEGINNDEVATKILALQTALQASYQTTSQLYQMSLVKFL